MNLRTGELLFSKWPFF